MTDRLWSPWRMEYIKEPEPGACVFCEAVNAPDQDLRSRNILAVRPAAFAILNKFPYAFAHIMVCPTRHVASLEQLDPTEQCEFFSLVADAQAALQQAVSPQGMNLGMNIGKDAGAGIETHIHMHLIPRWRGDTNFMPMLADCRLLPAHLDKTFEMLAPAFRPLSRP